MPNTRDSMDRDSKLFTDPKRTYNAIRRSKRSDCDKIVQLQVDNKTYVGDNVADGFYGSILNLKTKNHLKLESSFKFIAFSEDYRHIIVRILAKLDQYQKCYH